MTVHTTHPATLALRGADAPKGGDPVCWDGRELTDDSTALRDDAAVLRVIATRLARLLPTGRADVRADIALLVMVAGDVEGYASTMEDAAA